MRSLASVVWPTAVPSAWRGTIACTGRARGYEVVGTGAHCKRSLVPLTLGRAAPSRQNILPLVKCCDFKQGASADVDLSKDDSRIALFPDYLNVDEVSNTCFSRRSPSNAVQPTATCTECICPAAHTFRMLARGEYSERCRKAKCTSFEAPNC